MNCKDVYWFECDIDNCQCDERIRIPRALGKVKPCKKHCELCWLYCPENPNRKDQPKREGREEDGSC